MTLFPELKDDFTAENGVTYTWEENRWRTKSFLTADGSVVEVGPNPPPDPSEGGLWYDSTRLELFVFYIDGDGNGGWVPCSPLGARVEAGEIVQAQLVERVGELEKRDPELYLKKTGGTMTGQLACERSGTGNTYVFSCKAQGLPEGNQVAFRVTGDGAVKAGHSTSSPFMATAANDVLTKKYADDHTLQPDKSNDVTTSFRVKSGGNTLISASGNNLGLYNLSTPTNASHAVNLGYLQDNYVKLGGGTMTGALSCTRPGETAGGKYIFSCKAEGLEEGKQVAFRVTADGAVKAGHDTSHAFMASAANDVVSKKYLDAQIANVAGTERIYGFRDIGETATLHQKKITYSRQDGGQLTIPLLPESGPPIASPTSYFSFKSWTGQFSLVVEIAPGNWRTIFMGVTSQMRYSSTQTTPFFEVRIPDSGLFVNSPSAEYYDLPCKLKIAGFL